MENQVVHESDTTESVQEQTGFIWTGSTIKIVDLACIKTIVEVIETKSSFFNFFY